MEIGIVRLVRIEEEMKGAYLDYAMSVITARALPDVRDGLKPVQRRILYAMDELSLRHTAAYKKSARIVGEVLGKYHPHGDAPVYEAMVRMAQDFSMRYLLVDGQGNFGSVDGDPPAAMRYTEARLAALAEEMLADIEKNTVDFAANFDDTLKEPKVLPAKVPNLLVNGSSGIAVGMATNIPPHNLSEVADALTYLIRKLGVALDGGVPFGLVWARAFGAPIEHAVLLQALNGLRSPLKERVAAGAARHGQRPSPEQRAQVLLEQMDDLADVPPDKLMEMVKGPDFPTAAIVLGVEGIRNAYATGHGRITIRARVHTEDMRGGRVQIVITELPFQVNKASLLEKIAELVRERRVEGISELRDESDRQGMRVVIELRRDAQPRQVLNQLYKYTAMQTAFSVNMLALVDGQPRVLTLKMVLLHYLNHRREVITRRTEHDLERARQRAHILEGLKIALEHLDEVIATIRRSKDADAARAALMKNFKLTEIQAQAILDMQLRRLAALERQKILNEYAETLKLIARLEDLLAHPAKILYAIRDETLDLKSKHGDDRRTQIVAEEAADFTEEDLIPDQEVIVTLSAKGYVRRILADSYRLQRRGKGPTGVITKEDDPPQQMFAASTRDNVLMFSDRGRAYQIRVSDLPDVGKQSRGLPLSNVVSLDGQERIVSAVPVSALEGHYVLLATRRGEVKRVTATDYASARSGGIIGISVSDGDELLGAVLTSGRQEVFLVTAQGQAIRFAENELRASGRNSGGVRGIRLGDKDEVVSIDVARPDADLVVVTRRGFAKRMPMAEFVSQGRGGCGLRAAQVTVKNGELVAGHVAMGADELVLVAAGGTTLRTTVAMVQEMGRSAQGVAMISLDPDDKVVSAAILSARDKTPTGGKRGGTGDGPVMPDVEPKNTSNGTGGSSVAEQGTSRARGKTGEKTPKQTARSDKKQAEDRKSATGKRSSARSTGRTATEVVDKPVSRASRSDGGKGATLAGSKVTSGTTSSGSRGRKPNAYGQSAPALGMVDDLARLGEQQAGWKPLARATTSPDVAGPAERRGNTANPQTVKKAKPVKAPVVTSGENEGKSSTLVGAIVATVTAKVVRKTGDGTLTTSSGPVPQGRALREAAKGKSSDRRTRTESPATPVKAKAKPGQPSLPL